MVGKERPQDKWREIILEMQSSGKSQQDFCKEHNLSYSTMRRWYTKLFGVSKKPDLRSGQSTSWVEADSCSELETPSDGEQNFQIKVGCFTVTVPNEFNQATFTTIFKALMDL